MKKCPTVLMVLDGYGLGEREDGNAVKKAETPNLDKIMERYPCVKGYASGLDVGLPSGQMGNSEVGHLNIGAGRIVYQELTRITKDIEDGGFFENPVLISAINNCKKNNSALHLFGLLSDGGVHSHNTHLYALLRLAAERELKNVYIHAFLDGRDTPPSSGKDYVASLEEKIREIKCGKIATVSGRYYAMDRDKRWERVEKAYEAIVCGEGRISSDAVSAVEKSYNEKATDEFMLPAVIAGEDMLPVGKLRNNDSVIFFNFRPDRARELTRAICDPKFDGFRRRETLSGLEFVCFTQYDAAMPNVKVAYPPEALKNTLGEYISLLGLTQLRLAETEKYPHVTFFFNGGREEPYPGENRILIPSPKVATYDLKPEMSAYEVTDALVTSVLSGKYDLIVVNYANSDMVGHTGMLEAAEKAVEAVDKCVGRVLEALLQSGGRMLICADHGNSEQMFDYTTNEPFTAHTTNPVPFILVNYADGIGLREGGRLCDIAPTLLNMMDIKKPVEMTGESLLISK